MAVKRAEEEQPEPAPAAASAPELVPVGGDDEGMFRSMDAAGMFGSMLFLKAEHGDGVSGAAGHLPAEASLR